MGIVPLVFFLFLPSYFTAGCSSCVVRAAALPADWMAVARRVVFDGVGEPSHSLPKQMDSPRAGSPHRLLPPPPPDPRFSLFLHHVLLPPSKLFSSSIPRYIYSITFSLFLRREIRRGRRKKS